jgi:hypothetical protein
MTKIIRKRHFFRHYTNLILGTLWLSIGVAYFWVGEIYVFNILSFFNLLIGLVYLAMHFYLKERNQEFIAWDEEQVTLSKWQLKPKIYPIAEINKVTLTKSHFILNTSPEVPGETMELSGYSENDLYLLSRKFSPEFASS